MDIWAAFKEDGTCVSASAQNPPNESFMKRAADKKLSVRFVDLDVAKKAAAPGFKKCFEGLRRALVKKQLEG